MKIQVRTEKIQNMNSVMKHFNVNKMEWFILQGVHLDLNSFKYATHATRAFFLYANKKLNL